MASLIIFFCRVPSSLRPFFVGISQSVKEELFTEEQVKEALREYSEYNKLQSETPGEWRLDKLMISTLFNKKDPVIEGNPYKAELLKKKLLGKLQLFHHATRKDSNVSSLYFLKFSSKISLYLHFFNYIWFVW